MPTLDVTTVTGEDGLHPTYCRICEALCGMVATVENGAVTQLRPDFDNPHSQGHVCVKGLNMTGVQNDPERVIYPLKRTGGPGEFEEVSWDEALDDIAARLNAIIADHGAQAYATMYGNPPSFGFASFMAPRMLGRAIGGTRTFTPSSEDTSSTMLAHMFLYGSGSFAFPDLVECERLYIFGSNPLVSHGSLMIAPRIREDLKAIHERGEVVVFDPRRTETARAFTHQPVRPNSDVWLLAAMITTIAELGAVDQQFLDEWTTDATALLEALASVTAERAAPHTGIASERIRELAHDFAATPKAAAMGRLGICRGTFPTLANFLMHALNIVGGKFNQPGGFGFGHGAADTGEMLANAGMKGFEPGASRVSELPSVVGALPSVTLYDELTQGEGRVRALMASGSNAVLAKPGGHRLGDALEGLDLFFALDLYVTETTRHAHYILPATTFLERDDLPLIFGGHMIRPYMQFAPAAVAPRGEARVELDILRDIAVRMGLGEQFPEVEPIALADQLLRTGPEGDGSPTGLSIDMLREHPHGITLKRGRWAFSLEAKLRHADKRIHLFDPIIETEIERLKSEPDPDLNTLRLFGMRKLRSINSWMHNVDRLVRSDRPVLIVHPEDAAARGIGDGDVVRVSSRWGSVEVDAAVSDEVMPGSVCYPHGWGHARGGWTLANAQTGANINAIFPATADSAERVSGMSFMDGFPVELERASLSQRMPVAAGA